MIAVETKELKKEINKSLVLKNVNLTLETGNIYGIVGDNFSGRQELLKIISGLLKEYEGEVLVLGNSLKEEERYIENIGMAFGIEGFIEEYSGFKNLKILASIKESIDEEEIENALYILGLSRVIETKVKEYDFEMRKRLSIAQAIMEKPSIIVIDEPFMYFEPEKVEKISSLLKDINSGRRSTIILGARKDSYLKNICNDLYKIDKGEIQLIS